MHPKSALTSALKSTSALSFCALAFAAATPAAAQEEDEVLDQIIVTGSYIRRASQEESASPIEVVDQDDFRDIGAFTISDLTKTLTINSGAQNNPDAFTQNVSTGTSNINLRGLGVASTLVLLNSKRQVTSGAQTDGGVAFVDTASLIPTIAIESVEILKNGAAATYGSDAVGGVANFKTRKNFEGVELDLGIQAAAQDGGQQDIDFQGLYGHQGDRFRFTVAASYFDRSRLRVRERNLRPQSAADQLLSITGPSGTGLPGNFVLPTPPDNGDITQALAFLTFYDRVSPTFNATVPNPSPALALPDPLPALSVTTNPIPPVFPVPGVLNPFDPTGTTFLSPPASFTGFEFPSFGEGIINIPGPTAALLGLGDGSAPVVIGANGIADSLEASVNPLVFGFAAPIFAGQLNVPPELLVFPGVPTPDGTNSPFDGTIPYGIDPQTGQVSFVPLTPFFPDPQCAEAAGVLSDIVLNTTTFTNPLDFSTTEVGTCAYDFNSTFDIVPRQTRTQGYANWEYDVSDEIMFYGDFGFARNRANRNNSSFPIRFAVPIAQDYPFNPFGIPVFFTGRSPGSGQIANGYGVEDVNQTDHNSDTYRAMGGLTGEFGDGYNFDVSLTWGSNDFHLGGSADGVTSRLFEGLAGVAGLQDGTCDGTTPGANGCGFYNVFASGFLADSGETTAGGVPLRNSQATLDYIFQEVTIDIESEMWVADGLVTGELFDMEAGPVGFALGTQYRRESLSYDYDEFTNAGDRLFVGQASDFDNTRDVYAVFGEVAVPVSEDLDVQLALRFEEYGGSVGSTFDPKVAVLYRPDPAISFRGSFGTSFRAPSVFQLFGNQTNLQSVDDRRVGRGAPFIPILTQGNLDLSPEQSTNWNFGFTVEPAAGFQISADYWRIRFSDVIVQENAQDLADRALIGGETDLIGTQVFLNPIDGNLASVTARYINAAFIRTDGLDATVRYTWDFDDGAVQVGATGTWIMNYNLPGAAGTVFDGANSRNDQNFADPVPDFRANAWLTASYLEHSVSVYLRHIGSFIDDENTEFGTLASGTPDFSNVVDPANIGSHTTVDVQYVMNISELTGLETANVTIGAVNLFGSNPPFVFTDGAYETRTHDPRGRTVYGRVKVGF